MSTVAIIPAHNEAPRIAAVIAPVLQSGAVSRVVVVDDGSTDNTSEISRQAGAQIITLRPNRGKGQAMLAALRATHEPSVLFLDADLLGLKPGHIERLVRPVAQGDCVMTCGLRDYGPVWNRLQVAMPRITGERCVLRSVLERVPESFWSGFRVESGINAAAARAGPTIDVMLWGVTIVTKWEKEEQGFVRAAKMTREVLIALAESRKLQ